MIELSITCRNSEKSMTHKHLTYEMPLIVSKDDPTLSKLVQESEREFGPDIEDVIVKLKYTWR